MTSVFTFAEDFLSQGVPEVLDQIAATGADSTSLAVTYHQARDVIPRNSKRPVLYRDSGTTAFTAGKDTYGQLRPPVKTSSPRSQLLQTVIDQARQRDMSTAAWVVALHNSRLGHAHPELTVHNVMGDRLLHALCPAQSEVRRYVGALACDLVDQGVATIRVEALTAGGFDHGETHERALIYLGETARFLMGLCFCTACRSAAEANNIDVVGLAARIQHLLLKVLQSHAYAASLPELTVANLSELLGDSISEYLEARSQTVTSLAAEVATAVRNLNPEVRTVLLDPSGAALGYATGRPGTEAAAVSLGWHEGLDIEALSSHVDIGALCYFADPERTREEITQYRELLHPESRLETVLRPTWPDVTSVDQLEANVHAAHQGGASSLHFYAYGLVRTESLEWLGEVMKS